VPVQGLLSGIAFPREEELDGIVLLVKFPVRKLNHRLTCTSHSVHIHIDLLAQNICCLYRT
jgi:hypothetical protein